MNNYFEIDLKLPSLNEYQAECRANKYLGATFKKKLERDISVFIYKAKRAGTLRTPTAYPVELRIEWHEKDRRRDVDNIKSAAKFVLDTMTDTGVIRDDGRKYISQIHDTVIDDKRTFVLVEIIENEESPATVPKSVARTKQPKQSKQITQYQQTKLF